MIPKPPAYFVDSKPLPLLPPTPAGARAGLMRDEGARFGKTSKGWFFGFKLHAVRHSGGRILNIVLTPANCDDRDPTLPVMESTDGGI